MFGSTVLEVVIGLVFLYLSLSLACSALNEYYSALVSRRAAHLRDSIFLLFNKDDPKGLEFLLEFYTHPLISGLSPSKRGVASTATANPAPAIPPNPTLTWYQAWVIALARSVNGWAAMVAGWTRSLLGGWGWVVDVFRDPHGAGDALSGMRKELAVAARSTPHYIPDRAFSGAIFAVLASDAGALHRLQDQLKIQLDVIDGVVEHWADPAAREALRRRIASLKLRSDSAKTSEDILVAVEGAVDEWGKDVPADVPADKAAFDQVKAALGAVLAVGARTQVRDHVLTTLRGSLRKLEAAFATLPRGSFQDVVLEKVEEATARIGPDQVGAATSLERARTLASEAFHSIQGTILGLRGDVDSAKALAWVEQEVAALATSQDRLVTITKLRAAVVALPASDIRSALLSMMDEVGDDLDRVKRNIQTWYNDSMERVSGWYKRNTQVILAMIAVALAVFLNADTIVVAKKLWKDSALRANVGALAKSVDPELLKARPVAVPGRPGAEPLSAEWSKTTDQLLKQSDIPLGWTLDQLKEVGLASDPFASLRKWRLPAWDSTKAEALFAKVVGLVLTTIAISMGAPFWFDILNKLVNVRTSGLQPRKSEDRPSPATPPA